jgi:hypothetical protein
MKMKYKIGGGETPSIVNEKWMKFIHNDLGDYANGDASVHDMWWDVIFWGIK